MSENVALDRINGQLMATNVLLEALLQALPATTLKEAQRCQILFAENALDTLLNTDSSETYLAAARDTMELHRQMLTRLRQLAIQRDHRIDPRE